MQILEFGSEGKPLLVFIHGLESPYQVFNEYIDYYKEKYHIIIPILPGHNPSLQEDFVDFDFSVKEIEDYILNINEVVYAIYGMSLGGVFACKMLENNRAKIKKIILDGSPLVGFDKSTKYLLGKMYLTLTHKAQERDKTTIDLILKELITEDKLSYLFEVLDYVSDITINNYVELLASYKLPNMNSDTMLYYFYGDKSNEIFSKKTVQCLTKKFINHQIILFKDKAHCEVSVFTPNIMIGEFDKRQIL